MKFNPGIEGLRGIAIILVVLAHSGVPGMGTGFVGVDVFFVISGFLITGLLVEEFRRDGGIDYWGFYGRRVRRLVPALVLMVGLVSLAVVFLAPRPSWEEQLWPGAWALLWASNVYFSFAGLDYFGPAASDSLFLHTWSLGVEEQFYLVWPALLVLLLRRGKSDWRWFAFGSALGFALCLALTSGSATAGYFLMPSRLWQLLAGAAAWAFASTGGGSIERFHSLLGWSGLSLLATGLAVVSTQGTYPSWTSLLPTLGTVSLLLSVSAPDCGPALLRVAPLKLAGRVSYAWYLWHWPLLLLPVTTTGIALDPVQRVGLVLASLLIAITSYYGIEKPVRAGRGKARRVVLGGLGVSSAAAMALFFLPILFGPDWGRMGPTIGSRIQGNISLPRIYTQPGCDEGYQSSSLVPCEFAPAGNDVPTVVLLGDSVGVQWAPAMEHYVQERGRRLVVLAKSACPIVDEPIHYARINRRFTECEDWREAALDYIAATRPELVIIGSSQYEYSGQQWRQGTRRVVERIAVTGAQVVVLAPTPILSMHGPLCLASQAKLQGGQMVAEGCAQSLAEVDPVEIVGHLNAAVSGMKSAKVLYLNDLVCAEGACRALVAGRVTFRDKQHINAGFVEDLAPLVVERLDAAVQGTR